jgi:hypothetical protein
MRLVRGFAAFAAVGLLLLGCGDDDGDDAAPTATSAPSERTTTTEATTTTSATATTTFAQADDPPPLVNTGEDFDAIVRSFLAYGEWVSVHPDLDRLDDVFRRDGPAWQELAPVFSQLIAEGWHTNGDNPGVVHEARLLERPTDGAAIVYALIESPAFTIVDGAGSVIEEREAIPPTGWAYELRQNGDGQWLIESRTVLGEV